MHKAIKTLNQSIKFKRDGTDRKRKREERY